MATNDRHNGHEPSYSTRSSPSLTEPAPSKPPGERLASYFENFFKTVVGISTLGASLTFNKIIDNGPPTPTPVSNRLQVSSTHLLNLLSLSWLFFVLALAFTSFFASALSLWRPAAVRAFGTKDTEDRKRVLWFASGVSAFLLGLIVAAFITLSLVVAGYVGIVGWVAVAFTGLFGTLGFGTIIWRSPLEWPQWMRRRRLQQRGRVDVEDKGTFGTEEAKAEKLFQGVVAPSGRRRTRSGEKESSSSSAANVRVQLIPAPSPPPPPSVPPAIQQQQQQQQRQQQRQQQQQQQQQSSSRRSGDDTRATSDFYGRSTSGEYRPGGGSTSRRYGSGSGRTGMGGAGMGEAGYDAGRYSRASTVIADAYEPGRYGQEGYVYDDGVREGLVMSRYG